MKLMFQNLMMDHIFSALRTYKKFFCFIALVSFSTLAQTPLGTPMYLPNLTGDNRKLRALLFDFE